jgi:tetratricopeptide (TPR) repeat protein
MRRLQGCGLGWLVACTPVQREEPVKQAAPVETRAVEPAVEAVEVKQAVAEPDEPQWFKDVRAADDLRRAPGGALGAVEALEERAVAAIEGLPDDEPRILEALCLGATRSLIEQDRRVALWERAVAIEGRRPRGDVRADYASFGRVTPRVTAEYTYGLITFSGSPIGSRPTLSPQSLLLPTTYPEDCAQADRVFLRMQLVDAWHSAGMAGAMVSPTGVGGAAEDRKYATAAALFVDLFDTAVRELGAEDPLLATFYDYGHAFCDRVTRRSHGRSVCMPERKALERALALREAGFGSDHPLTNSSRVSLAGTLLTAYVDVRRAEELIKAAAASRPGSVATISALRTLAALRLFRFENDLAEQAAAEAVQVAHDVLDREKEGWEYDTTLAFHARLAAAAGKFERSINSYELVRKTDRGLFAYELAEVQMAAARYEDALASYEADMASIEAASPERLDWYEASRMVRSAKGRVAMLERLGPAETLAAARERVKELEKLAKAR